MSSTADRKPHAGYEREGRIEKAEKLARLIERRRPLAGVDLLEIGCGSGWMTADFARRVGPDGSVAAVDRYDQRRTSEGFEFTAVEGTTLPHPDAAFDIVISNHVMEHVGVHADQVHHLTEIRRVLRDDGLIYFSVPNRWRVIEPHFKLPFLSWLPQGGADRYVRLTHKGDWYDVVSPSHRTMQALFDEAGLLWEDATFESMEVMAEVETVNRLEKAVLTAPHWLTKPGWWFIPSMIYFARKPPSGSAPS